MDSCFVSLSLDAEAMAPVRVLTATGQLGGFQLVKWISNSKSVLEYTDMKNRAKEVIDLELDRDSLVKRPLGLLRCVETDTLRVKSVVQERPLKR